MNLVGFFILSMVILAHQIVPRISMGRRAVILKKALLSELLSVEPIADSVRSDQCRSIFKSKVSNSLPALAHKR
jgi:hypothetical protein